MNISYVNIKKMQSIFKLSQDIQQTKIKSNKTTFFSAS